MAIKTDVRKFAVKQAGILVHKIFDSEAEAEAWAKRNYRGDDWEIVPVDPQ